MALPKPSPGLLPAENYKRFGAAFDAIDRAFDVIGAGNDSLAAQVAAVQRVQGEKQDRFDLSGLLARIAGINAGLYPSERPGDNPTAFTDSPAGGGPDDRNALNPAFYPVRIVGDGLGLEVAGSREVWERTLHACEIGRLWRPRWRLTRTRNARDPDGDAVERLIAWYSAGRTLLSTVQVAWETPLVSQGAREYAGFVGDPGAAGVTIPKPLGAAYFRIGIKAYGNEALTVLTDLGAADVSSIRDAILALAPLDGGAGLSARIEVEIARAQSAEATVRDALAAEVAQARAAEAYLQTLFNSVKNNSSGENLLYNPDMILGDGGVHLVPNDALDVVGIKNFVTQQATINPFMSVRRFVTETGGYGIRVTNGIPSESPKQVGYGPKTFFVGSNAGFYPGIEVTAVYSEDVSIKMTGPVASYSDGNLTIDVKSISGSGIYPTWVIGRVGVTKQGQTFLRTTQPTTPGDVNGGRVLYVEDTKDAQVGAAVERSDFNNISKATYIVSKTQTTILLSKPVEGVGVPAGYSITIYGNQGVFLYQNLETIDMGGLKYGTPQAADSYLSFDVRSRFATGVASIMYLGYSSLTTLGRSYVEAYPVTETTTRQTIRIKGDTVGAPNTWRTGYDVNDGYPFACIGWAPESQGTPTAKNIPAGAWSNEFAVGGCDQQTLDIGSVVGAFFEISNPKYELFTPTAYAPPGTLRAPVPDFTLRSIRNPRLVMEATRNAPDQRKTQQFLDALGAWNLQGLNDAETIGSILMKMSRDGTLYLPGYPQGVLQVGAGGVVGLQPSGPFDDFLIQSAAEQNPSGVQYGARRGRLQLHGRRVDVQLSVHINFVTAAASGREVMSLPENLPSNARAWYLFGSDDGKTGLPLMGYIPPNSAVVYVTLLDGSYPGRSGSTLNLSGFYETA